VSSSRRHQKLTLNPFGLTLQTGYPHNTSLVLSLCVCNFILFFKRMKFWLLCFLKGNFAKNVTRCWFWMIICQKKEKKALTHYVAQHPSMYHPFGNPIWLSYGWTTTELPTTLVNILEKRNHNLSIFLATYLLEIIIKIWQLGFSFFRNLVYLGHLFSMKKSFIYVKILFFRSKFGKILLPIKF